MAPKRAPLPPPVESSEKTGYGSDESQEEMDQSIPRAAALENTAPLPQKVQQSEAEEGEEEEGEKDNEGEEEEVEEEKDEQHQEEEEGDEEDEEGEEEEGDEEDEEGEGKKGDEEDEEGEEEEGDGEDEEGEEKDTECEEDEQHQEEEEGDGDNEEGEEEDTKDKEEEEEEEGGKQPLLKEAKKPASPWPEEDEVHFLNAIIAHRRKHGKLPRDDELEAILAGSLEYSPSQLKNKIKNLRNFYRRNICKVKPPSMGRNARIICLCKAAWDEDDMLAYDTVSSDFGEMCEAYPYLGDEFKAQDREHPGLFKRAFTMISVEEAYSLNQRIKEAEIGIMEEELKGQEMDKEIIKMLMDLME
jgi:hypothetical protein